MSFFCVEAFCSKMTTLPASIASFLGCRAIVPTKRMVSITKLHFAADWLLGVWLIVGLRACICFKTSYLTISTINAITIRSAFSF